MIYLFTATYCEAEFFIKKFGLKKVLDSTCFQHFCSEQAGVRLTVTGVGEIAAAAAVSSICTKYKPETEDILLNAGICAGIDKREGIFLVNKLVEQATGKTFYPDLLYRHPFPEAGLMTGMRPWTSCRKDKEMNASGDSLSDIKEIKGVSLFDMEAAAVYQAGVSYFGPHQMAFIKIISDSGETREDIRQRAGRLMAQYGDEMADVIARLMDILKGKADLEKRQEDAWITQVCADLCCSKSMEYSFRQHIRYMYLSGIDYRALIQHMYAQGRLPCASKREGKLRFEEFKKQLF